MISYTESPTLLNVYPSLSPVLTKFSKVTLNLNGHIFHVPVKTLQKWPHSRLGQISLASSISDILPLVDEMEILKDGIFLYFDRSSLGFDVILNFYRTGKLHEISSICPYAFSEELDYWKIEESIMNNCCFESFMIRKDRVHLELCDKTIENSNTQNQKCSKLQVKIWNYLERPHSSKFAKLIHIASISMIILSIIGMSLNTIDGISSKDEFGHTLDNPILEVVEGVCISWFLLEYILRFIGAPHKVLFLKGFLNFVDLMAIFPYFLSLIIVFAGGESYPNLRKALQVFRLLRIFRILKLSRYSSSIQSIGYSLRHSYQELGLFMTMGVLIFSSLIYFAEKEEEASNFTSIPSSFWWAIITMTTVGYGDVYPVTILGKITGSLCALSGLLVLAMAAPLIVNNFERAYKELLRKEKREKNELK